MPRGEREGTPVRGPRTGTEERVIGEHTCRVTLLGARAGVAMAVRLAKWLAPSAANGVEGLVGSRSDGFGSFAVGIGECIRELVLRVTAEELAAVQAELAKQTIVVIVDERETREPTLHSIFDDHFAGHYDALMAWFAFALEANFRSFFAGTAGASADVVAAVERLWQLMQRLSPPASESPVTSNGTSTASQPAAGTTPA